MANKIIFKKWVSAAFGIFFTIAQIFSYAETASGQTLSASETPSAYEPLDALVLPEAEGVVETVFKGDQPGWVAIIKDAHAIPQTQGSIARILTRLEKEYGVDWIGAEGAAGTFQTELFRSFPDAQHLKNLLNHFIERGELGGAALAALTSKGPAVFEGIEDPQTYEAGLRDYQRARAEAEGWDRAIDELEQKITSLKKKHYSLRAQNWDLKISRMDASGSEARAWANVLLEMRRRIPHFSKKYPNLNAVWSEMRISRAGAASMQLRIQDWTSVMEQKDPALRQLASWQADAQAWRIGELSDAEYAVRLKAFCEARELKIRLPESLSALVSLGGRLKSLRSGAWIHEWSQAMTEAEKFVFTGKEEKQVFELDQILNKIKKAAQLKINRDEWVALLQIKEMSGEPDFEIKSVADELQSLSRQFLKSASADFYRGAVKREDYFENKLGQSLAEKKGRRTAVVLGGFHAEDLAQSLRKKGISFVVLMPATGVIPETTAYENLMRGEASWSSHFKIVNGRIRIYESFAAAMIHRLLDLKQQKHNPEQVLAHFKSWRENLIRGALETRSSQKFFAALRLLDKEVMSSLYGSAAVEAGETLFQQTAAQSFASAQAVFRSASGMTLQPWIAAPLGDLTAAPSAPNLPAPEDAETVRSEHREENQYEEGGKEWIRLFAWTLSLVGAAVIGWQFLKMYESTKRFYEWQEGVKTAELQRQQNETAKKKAAEERLQFLKDSSKNRSEAREGEEDQFDRFGMLQTGSRLSANNFHANLTNNDLATMLYFSRFRSSFESLIKTVQGLSEPKAFKRFRADMEDLASWDVRVLSRHFGPDDRKVVMAFILMTAPDLFEKTKSWHHDFFNKLKRLRLGNPEFFDGALPVVLDSDLSLVLARKSPHVGDKALVMAFAFSEHAYKSYGVDNLPHRFHVVGYDGKADATVHDGLGRIIKPEATYNIQDGLYPELNYGQRNDLFSEKGGWKIRVPFRNPAKHEEGWDRVQALILSPTQEAPKGSLSSYLRNATSITFFPDEDGSYFAELKDIEQLANVHETAMNYGYIVTMDHPLSTENFHNPPPKIKIRLYPREVRGNNLTLRQKMNLLFERQVRTGQLVREDGQLKWVPFMRIIEDGETVHYAVYKNGKASLYRGGVPADAQADADYIFILNADRAKRPGVSASSPSEWPSDAPGEAPYKTIEVAPSFIEGQIPDEMFFYVAGPSGQRWMYAPNRFPILPPWLDRPQEEQPQALVITHEVSPGQFSYPQNRMHDEANVYDLLYMHAELEGVAVNKKSSLVLAQAISTAMGKIFKEKSPDAYNLLITGKERVVAVNGYHPPSAPVEAHGGASQLHGHAQQVHFRLPLQNLADSNFTNIGEFSAGDETIQVFVMDAQGQTALVFEKRGQRAFVFSRPNGKPEGFTGFWSFMELGRAIVIDEIARFFELTPAERDSLQRSSPPAWLRQNAEKLIQRGVHPQLLSDAQKAFSRNRRSVTASPGIMKKLGLDVIAAMGGVARSEMRLSPRQSFLAIGLTAEKFRAENPAHFVPAAIVDGNLSAAKRSEERTKLLARGLISGMDAWVAAHFLKSDLPLHLGFIMAYDVSAESDMLALAQKIKQLQDRYGSKIENHFTVLILKSDEANARKFSSQIRAAGSDARVISGSTQATGLLREGHVFAYGIDDFEALPAEIQYLMVESNYTMNDIFAAALTLNLATAAEPKLTQALLEQISEQFENIFGLNRQSGRLTALKGILEAKWLEAVVARVFSASA